MNNNIKNENEQYNSKIVFKKIFKKNHVSKYNSKNKHVITFNYHVYKMLIMFYYKFKSLLK